MWSKKLYEAVAKILAEACYAESGYQRNQIGYDLAELFTKDSPKFDRDRFLKTAKLID